jgi:hypothetical protein
LKGGAGRFAQRQRYSLTGRGVKDLEHAKKIKLVESVPKGLTGKALEKAERSAKLSEEAFNKGYMSAPGVAHALMSKQAPDLVRNAWKRGGAMGKAFAGLGAYETASGLARPPEGQSRLEAAGRGLGSTVGWLVAPHTLAGGHLVGMGSGAIGGKIGKGMNAAKEMATSRKKSRLRPAAVDPNALKVRGQPVVQRAQQARMLAGEI